MELKKANLKSNVNSIDIIDLPHNNSKDHHSYKVINEFNRSVGIHMLELFFGSIWNTALDRMSHQMDGYLFSIQHKGKEYKIYRKLRPNELLRTPKLQLIKCPS